MRPSTVIASRRITRFFLAVLCAIAEGGPGCASTGAAGAKIRAAASVAPSIEGLYLSSPPSLPAGVVGLGLVGAGDGASSSPPNLEAGAVGETCRALAPGLRRP